MSKVTEVDRYYVRIVDEHFRAMMAANSAEPYDHAKYERCRRLAHAAIMLLAAGDEQYAKALIWAYDDSNESMSYYLSEYSRSELLHMSGLVPLSVSEDDPSTWAYVHTYGSDRD